VGGWEGKGCFAHKSIYWFDFEILIFFALSNLTIAVKFLRERKRRINFNTRFSIWLPGAPTRRGFCPRWQMREYGVRVNVFRFSTVIERFLLLS